MNCQGSSHAWSELRSDHGRDVRCDCGALSFNEHYQLEDGINAREQLEEVEHDNANLSSRVSELFASNEELRGKIAEARRVLS